MPVKGGWRSREGTENLTQHREIEALQIDLNFEQATGRRVLPFNHFEKLEYENMFLDVYLYTQPSGQICFWIYPTKTNLQWKQQLSIILSSSVSFFKTRGSPCEKHRHGKEDA